jgi:hypothetical protein
MSARRRKINGRSVYQFSFMNGGKKMGRSRPAMPKRVAPGASDAGQLGCQRDLAPTGRGMSPPNAAGRGDLARA